MQTVMSLYHQSRANLPWARAWVSRVIRRSATQLASFAEGFVPQPEPEPVPVPVRRPRIGIVAAVLAMGLAASAAHAAYRPTSDRYDWNSTADGQLVDVQVVVGGDASPLYFRPGGNPFGRADDRFYFQAFEGRNYALRLRNNSGRRVGVLIAVDGLNVVNGERSRLNRNEPMYVLDPWETATIRGWRTSLNQVRKFVFVDEQRSYAERTGQANGDMGWIRVLAFNEAGVRPWIGQSPRYKDDEYRWEGARERDQMDVPRSAPAPSTEEMRAGKPESAPRAQAAPSPSNSFPGTGWGDRSEDHVSETWFVAASQAADQLVFRYEYASGLRALGIQIHRDRLRERDNGNLGFARPPRW